MPKNFVTIHVISKNVDLIKDVGMIPYTMDKRYGYKSTLVTFRNEESYSNMDNCRGYLFLEFIPKGFPLSKVLLYLIRKAKKIDILNMYHPSLSNTLTALFFYKMINRAGISYLKLDLDHNGIRLLGSYQGLDLLVRKFLLKKIDIISAESQEIADRFSEKYNVDVVHIPNGCYMDHDMASNTGEHNFLSVGRLGTEQKNTGLLIDAFLSICDRTDWDLVLAGPATDGFFDKLNDVYMERPDLKARIRYLGEIVDRNELMTIYSKASIFILPSRWESFGIVAVEALYAGDYLILSDKIPPARDLINSGKCGMIFESEDRTDLACKMLKATNIHIDHEAISQFSKRYFSWDIICQTLDRLIEGKR